MNIFQRVRCRRNNSEIILELLQRLKYFLFLFQAWLRELKQLNNF